MTANIAHATPRVGQGCSAFPMSNLISLPLTGGGSRCGLSVPKCLELVRSSERQFFTLHSD